MDVKFGREIIGNDVLLVCLDGVDGGRVGHATLVKPEVRAGVLGMLAIGDARLFERMSELLEPVQFATWRGLPPSEAGWMPPR